MVVIQEFVLASLIMLIKLKKNFSGLKSMYLLIYLLCFPLFICVLLFLICHKFAGLSKVTGWSWYGASVAASTQCPRCCQVYNESQRLQVQWEHNRQHSGDTQQDCYSWTLHSRAGESLPSWHLHNVWVHSFLWFISLQVKNLLRLFLWDAEIVSERKWPSCSLGMTEKPCFCSVSYPCLVKCNELCYRPQNFLQKNRCGD